MPIKQTLKRLLGRESIDRLNTAMAAQQEVLDAVGHRTRAQDFALCRIGPFLHFVFRWDFAYTQLGADDRELPNSLLEAHNAFEYLKSHPSHHENLLRAALTVLGERSTRTFDAIDVGCQYGSSAMVMASEIDRLGLTGVVHGFDCGEAGDVAGFNIVNNGYAGRVKFDRSAVGAIDRYVTMSAQVGHTSDNRIVNNVKSSTQGYISRIVQCERMDTLFPAQGRHYYLKIDTQGGEPEVLRGASRFLDNNHVIMSMEYTPHAYANRVNPVEFLEHVRSRFFLADIGCVANKFEAVSEPTARFAERIDLETHGRWTDLLCVDRRLGPEAFLAIANAVRGQMPVQVDEAVVG